uniref:Disease resistance protein At5g66910 family n=1 Tax=Cajanus cajan TaxID=3821 RepID=A0A151QPT0_CAJCA|nr:putative disease resistance protein At5g66910 family [Cajanus cajan]
MDMIADAVVGAVFQELLRTVLDITSKAITFKQSMGNLQSTLEAIAPLIREIEQHNNELGRPKEELESLLRKMEEGTKLVCKCSTVGRLDYVGRVRYQNQIEELSNWLMRFFVIDLQAQMARDLKETLRRVSGAAASSLHESHVNSSTKAQSLVNDSAEQVSPFTFYCISNIYTPPVND